MAYDYEITLKRRKLNGLWDCRVVRCDYEKPERFRAILVDTSFTNTGSAMINALNVIGADEKEQSR